MERRAEEMGLRVNEGKTKYMVMSTFKRERQLQDLKIGNEVFEEVNTSNI